MLMSILFQIFSKNSILIILLNNMLNIVIINEYLIGEIIMINKNKQGGFAPIVIVIFAGIITGIYLGILGIKNAEAEQDRTPSERIVSINEQYLSIVEYKNKTEYVTPQYLDSLKFQINQFDSEINKLKTKINYSKNNDDHSDNVKSEVSSLDNKLIELNKIYTKQSESIAKPESKSNK